MRMRYDTWERRFKPRANPRNPEILYIDWGQRWEKALLKRTPNNLLWTIVDVEGKLLLLPGWHLVNRFAYVICGVPWSKDDEDLEVRYA